MPEHHFRLELEGDLTDTRVDALYASGCSDALVGSVDGAPFAEFDREAPRLAAALLSAIDDVESVPGLMVTAVTGPGGDEYEVLDAINTALALRRMLSRLGADREPVLRLAS